MTVRAQPRARLVWGRERQGAMGELVTQFGLATKLIEGEAGPELVRVAPYPANTTLIVASRYRVGARLHHVRSLVTTIPAATVWFGCDGWRAPVPGLTPLEP